MKPRDEARSLGLDRAVIKAAAGKSAAQIASELGIAEVEARAIVAANTVEVKKVAAKRASRRKVKSGE